MFISKCNRDEDTISCVSMGSSVLRLFNNLFFYFILFVFLDMPDTMSL